MGTNIWGIAKDKFYARKDGVRIEVAIERCEGVDFDVVRKIQGSLLLLGYDVTSSNTPAPLVERDSKPVLGDGVKAFLDSMCEVGCGEEVLTPTDTVRAVYDSFCACEGYVPLEARKLGEELAKTGVVRTWRKGKGGARKYYYVGLRVK